MGSIPAAAHPRLIWGSPTSATQRHSFGSLAALCHPTDVFTSLFHLPEMLGMNVPKLCQKELRLGTDQIYNFWKAVSGIVWYSCGVPTCSNVFAFGNWMPTIEGSYELKWNLWLFFGVWICVHVSCHFCRHLIPVHRSSESWKSNATTRQQTTGPLPASNKWEVTSLAQSSQLQLASRLSRMLRWVAPEAQGPGGPWGWHKPRQVAGKCGMVGEWVQGQLSLQVPKLAIGDVMIIYQYLFCQKTNCLCLYLLVANILWKIISTCHLFWSVSWFY